MSKKYIPVPVEIAKQIAEQFEKGIVIINAWDNQHGFLHTTTYGVSDKEKHWAAKGGEIAALALGSDLARKTQYEDFRKDKEKMYVHLSNGDFNDETTIDDTELVRWEICEGAQKYVIITRDKISAEDYTAISKILDKYGRK